MTSQSFAVNRIGQTNNSNTLPRPDSLVLMRACDSCCDRHSGYNQECRRLAGLPA